MEYCICKVSRAVLAFTFMALAADRSFAGTGNILKEGSSGNSSAAVAAYYGGNQAALSQLPTNANDILARTNQAIQSVQAMQQAARNAALGGANNLGVNPQNPQQRLPDVPNGLIPGGLQVATGQSAEWSGANQPVQSVVNGRTTVTIQQTAQQAILNWETFNVGKNTTAYFNQSGGGSSGNTWIALNRVLDPSGVPSQILGSIVAQGSVYVINQNGIIFGGSSQVNTHSFIGSAVGITDIQFKTGIINQQPYTVAGYYAVINPPTFVNNSGPTGDIVVKPGAVIQTSPPASVKTGGGSVYLFGSDVENDGWIITPDGQTVLAATGQPSVVALPIGSSGVPGVSSYKWLTPPRSTPQAYTFPSDVYLTASTNPNIRGVTVLMDNGGTVTNNGLIAASTGNITMTGMNVRQSGILAATTSVDQAGSITLFAGSGGPIYSGTLVSAGLTIVANNQGSGYVLSVTQTGIVTLAAGSITTVLPEENGAMAMDTQTQPQSIISIEAQTINVLSNSTIFAPSGHVSLEVSSLGVNLYLDDNPGSLYPTNPLDTSRVWVDSGALIDVSGLQDVSVPVQDDAVQVNVRANELRDSPLQRNGILESQNVWVNINELSTVVPGQQVYTAGGLLEVSGWLGLTERPIDQRLTTGGSIVIVAGGDAILRPQSSIGIAGGWLYHQAGYVPVTWLLGADGRLYTVNNAPADLTYVSIGDYYGVDHPRWGIKESYANPMLPYQMYEGAYVEGKPAGSLSIVATHSEIDASVIASVVSGPFQRTATTLPAAGSLTIGGGFANPTQVVIALVIAPPDLASDISPLPDDWLKTLYLSANLLDQAGYCSITISTGSLQITENATLQVAAGGSITVNASGGLTTATGGLTTTAPAITISGSLIAPGGSVSLYANNAAPRLAPPSYDIVLEPGSVIDTRGLWVNDFVDQSAVIPTLYNGGNVTIRTYDDVRIDTGAVIDASSGGWVQINGKIKANNNGLPVGTGGNITLLADDYALQTASSDPTQGSTVPETYPTQVDLDGTVRSFGFTAGGQLTIVTPGIQIGGVGTPNAERQTPNATTPLLFGPSFFATTGFCQYTLYSYQGVTIANGTDLELHALNFVPNGGTIFAPNGSDPTAIAPIGRAPGYELPGPVNLLLSATDAFVGDLVLGHGAIINADPGATIALHARHQMTIDGTIYAPAGTIDLDLTGSTGPIASVGGSGPAGAPFDAPFPSAAQTLWIGSDARLLAPGVVESFAGPNGSVTNVLRDGGTVNINQDLEQYYPYPQDQPAVDIPLGTVVAKAGAIIDVSGVSGVLYQNASTGFGGQITNSLGVSSNGGTIAVTASMGLFFDATMKAAGGGPRSAGGNFILDQVAGDYTSNVSNPTFVQPVFLLLVSQSDPMLSTGLQLGQAIPSSYAGELFISADQIMNSGFSSASLGAVDGVVFNGNVELSLSRSLRINARNIGDGTVTPLSEVGTDTISDGAVVAPLTGAVVTLSAPYVNIGGGQRGGTTEYIGGIGFNVLTPPSATGTPVAGTAVLNINADLIDIEGLLRTGATYQYLYNGVLNPVTLQNGTLTPNPVSLAGFKTVSFNSTGDIRLVPMTGTLSGPSLLTTLGDLNFTATEIYPVTSEPQSDANTTSSGTLFQILASGMNSVITFARTGATPYVPLSAAGAVQIVAPTIDQGGVILAPLGQITFGNSSSTGTQATNINLLPGSITSVSADGALIPYGATFGANQWNYNGITLFAPPQKLIAFYGQNVTISGANGSKPAAMIDESGGGDIYATQFISGSGGSTDTLDGTETFAILPSLGNHYAPVDPVMQSSNPVVGGAPPVNLSVGDQVYLTGIPGLPAGEYTLLPGHYALLPGAYKLTVEASQTTTAGLTNLELADGSYQVIGYRTVANTNIQDSLPSVFLVSSGSVVREHSEYTGSTGDIFFPSLATSTDTVTPYLARDAGYLIIDIPSNSGHFVFQGASDFSYPAGARGGQADIVVGNLDILGPGDTTQAGYVGIQASQLDALGVQSLLLGGVRNLDTSSVTLNINPSAQAIIVDANAVLSGPEIMLTATGSVTVASNARIDTTGYGSIADLFLLDPITHETTGSISVNAAAVFLQVSNANSLPVNFTQGTGTSVLTINSGAEIYAGNTLFLGAQTLQLDPSARFGGQTVTVQTPIIAFGSGGSSGLVLTNSLLAALSQGDVAHGIPATADLVLNATQEIDVYGSATLGDISKGSGLPLLSQLTLETPAINGFGGVSDNVSITAGTVLLLGTGFTLPTAGTGTGQGQFTINATQIVIGGGGSSATPQPITGGGGIMAFSGFDNVVLAATGEVTSSKGVSTSNIGQSIGGVTYYGGQVIPGTLDVFGSLTIQTPLVTSASGAVTQLSASGSLTFAPSNTVTNITPTASDGGTLKINAQTIVDDTKMVLPSGAITFTAQNGITLGSGAEVSVAGAVTPFFDVVRISPAGSLTLQTTNGNVVIAPGAVVDVTGGSLSSASVSHLDAADSDAGGTAGSLTIITPNGTADLAGTFLGGAPEGYTGGKVILNLSTGDAASLLSAVTTFTGEQSLTLATGDISVGNITAQDVELSASTGSVSVYGTINASGSSGGTIRLTAGLNLTLAATAVLNASATSALGAGGIVFLGLDGKSSGTVTLAGGSIIDVSGTGPNGNEVWLRAPRVNNTGVAISNQGVTVTGANKLIVEGVAVYDITSNPYVDENLTATSQAVVDANNFMANAGAIDASLGSLASSPAFQLLPGIELRSNGNLTLLTNPSNSTGNPYAGTSYIYNDGIDLGGLRFNGAPGVLTLRAADNLIINGSLSDGFAAPVVSPDGPIFAIAPLAGGPSWSLRLVGGADLKSADPLGLIAAINVPVASTSDPEPGSVIFNAPYLVDSNASSGLGAALEIPSVVRTGTGDLELAAAGNIDIQTEFGIYTAGEPSAAVPGFTIPIRQILADGANTSYLGYQSSGVPWDNAYPTALYPSYPTSGGNLTVKVQGNLISQPTNLGGYAGSELDPYWLWTEPNLASPTWFINFGTYYQDMAFENSIGDIAPTVAGFLGLGALGGGNVNVSVGGNMTNVDVSLPTTGRVSNGQVVITGGGNLNLSVGGSLNNSNLYVGKGVALVQAADIGMGLDSQGNRQRVNFMISDAQLTVYSRQNIFGLLGDPTRTLLQNGDGVATENGGYIQYWGLEGLGLSANFPSNVPLPYGFFGTYTANSSFNELAEGGDITVEGSFAPPILSFVAASGSISGLGLSFGGYLVALPAPTARLSILAQQDVQHFGVSMTAADMALEQNGVYLQPNGIPDLGLIAAPSGYDYAGTILDPYEYAGPVGPNGNVFVGPPSNLVLSNDPHTVVVYAVEGSLATVDLATPERASIRAGLDIVQPVFNLENTNANDTSLIEAGRDITSAVPGGILGTDIFNIRLEGQGTLVVQAGRNIVSEPGEYNTQGIGIESVGNTDNPYYLPSGGATIDISVGVGFNGADITGFINTYLNPVNAGSVQKNYLPQLLVYMNQLEGSTLTPVEALADFEQLSAAEQWPLIAEIYFDEIKAGGESYAATKIGYNRAYKAIETLFPGSSVAAGVPTTAFNGSLTLYHDARIRTEQGGDINLMVPGGGVTLGVETDVPNLAGQTDTAEPGLITMEGGSINVVADQSVVVAQSRIFTELGGDILIWSSHGDINSGKGKQTSIVTRAPNTLYNLWADMQEIPATPQTGAGIATLIGVQGVPPGNVDLFAPNGIIDAGEAGIRVSGNLTVAALEILHVQNIQVQGHAVGLPTIVGPNVAAAIAASNTAGGTNSAAEEAVKQQTSATEQEVAPSLITVEVLGYGGADE